MAKSLHLTTNKDLRQRTAGAWRIVAASPGDLGDYLALLTRAGLPPEGLAECLGSARVARAGGGLVGAVAIEPYGDAALLRSLVVDATERGGGLGTALVEAALDLARIGGASSVYLLTESAAPFFARRGFATVARDEVPPAVRSSVQFLSVCPQSATAMRLALDRAEVPSHPNTSLNR